MEKNRNPNSHECLRQDPSSSWSELPLDLLSSVFKRLGFADFQRGKSVCSSWYSASRQFVPKNQIPSLILFPKDKHENSCTLFNPEEKHKLYKTQDLGVEFAKSVCLATYGSWLLMRDPLFNLYVVNLFTQERINLPPMESQLGMTKIKRLLDDWFSISNDHNWKQTKGIVIQSPVFWIDEKTKDYVVLWGLGEWCVFYSKKGDTSWNQIPETSKFFDMVYKDHKLYFLSRLCSFKVFDFSGQIPQETFQCGVVVNELVIETKLVVTVTGDVLKVEKMFGPWPSESSFRIYKVWSSGFLKKCEQVDTLGDEAMLFDLGITVLANDIEGLNRNSIYLDGRHASNTAIFLFNLETQKMERLQNFDFSPIQFSKARWFLPSFTQT